MANLRAGHGLARDARKTSSAHGRPGKETRRGPHSHDPSRIPSAPFPSLAVPAQQAPNPCGAAAVAVVPCLAPWPVARLTRLHSRASDGVHATMDESPSGVQEPARLRGRSWRLVWPCQFSIASRQRRRREPRTQARSRRRAAGRVPACRARSARLGDCPRVRHSGSA